MCLIAFAIQASPRWPLAVAANRDEFFARSALPLAEWQTPGGQAVVSGRDLRGGGTWLGVTPQGRVAMLTNVRQADNPPRPRTRGELVTRWLDGGMDVDTLMDGLDGAAYGGFNLVVGDAVAGRWSWLSNRSFDAAGLAFDDGGLHRQDLPPGVYGLSNASLDTPWPKTVALTQALRQALALGDAEAVAAQLHRALENRERAPLASVPPTGIPPAREHMLSSALVSDPDGLYGTRCSTVLLAGDGAKDDGLAMPVRLEEITRAPDGTASGSAAWAGSWRRPAAAHSLAR